MKMVFVRHGETDWNVKKQIQGCTDIELNETGFLQAQSLADVISEDDLQIDHIYSSKLKRASRTAEIIACKLEVPMTILDGLEEMNLGEWEGKTWAEIPELYPEVYATWHKERRYTRTPGGESYQDLLDRLLPALQYIIRQNQNVLIVTHSAVIMTLQSFLQQTPFYEMSKRYRVGNAQKVILDSEEILSRIEE